MILICLQGRTKPDPGAETTAGWGLPGLSQGRPGERKKETGGAGAEAAEGGGGAAAEAGRREAAAGAEPGFTPGPPSWALLKCERKQLEHDGIMADLNSSCHFYIYYIFTESVLKLKVY